MAWSFDPSEPFITPDQVWAAPQSGSGTAQDQRLPPTLIGAFQTVVYQHFLEQASAEGQRPNVISCGAVNAVPVAIVRISIGAPAAALVLEEGIARGVQTILIAGAV